MPHLQDGIRGLAALPAMPHDTEVRTFIISLPKDTHRRACLARQCEDLRLPFSILDAVHGASLSHDALQAVYDEKKAIALFNRGLSRGEIGCALSHVGIYRKMVEEDIPYALVLEDDAKILDDDVGDVLAGLARHYPADTPVAVLMSHVERYDGNGGIRLDARRRIHDAYRGVCAHGYFITRAAAGILAANLYPVHVVADKWEYFQEKLIAVKALVPYAIGLTPASRTSSIDAMGARTGTAGKTWNFPYYLRKNLARLRFLMTSQPFIDIKYQARSQRDIH